MILPTISLPSNITLLITPSHGEAHHSSVCDDLSLPVSHHNSVIRCDISNSTHNYFPSITHTITSTHFSPLLSIHQQSSPHHLTLPPLTDLPVSVVSQVVLGLYYSHHLSPYPSSPHHIISHRFTSYCRQ